MLEAASENLKISDNKNGRMGKTLHHKSMGSNGAMEDLSRRVHHIIINKGTEYNLLCDVLCSKAWTEVTIGDISKTVRTAAKTLKLQEKEIDPGMIGAHSLKSGGSMAIKIMGYKDSTIRKCGRWTSDTRKKIIHSQISKL